MDTHDQQTLRGNQTETKQRPPLQIKRPPGELERIGVHLHDDWLASADPRKRLTVYRNECCAQALVTRHQRIHGPRQSPQIHRTIMVHCNVDDVELAVWYQSVKKPETLLRERGRENKDLFPLAKRGGSGHGGH